MLVVSVIVDYRQEVMWQVTGQVDGQRDSKVIATCESCGNQWVVEE